MYYLLGGYLLSPEQIKAWFRERDIELIKGLYTVLGNRYLREKKFEARSCDYNGQHNFLVLTHKAAIDDSVAMDGSFNPFAEDDHSRHIKGEMVLVDTEFVTIAVYAG